MKLKIQDVKKIFLSMLIVGFILISVFGKSKANKVNRTQMNENNINSLLIDEHNEAVLETNPQLFEAKSDFKTYQNKGQNVNSNSNEHSPLDDQFFDDQGFAEDLDFSSNFNSFYDTNLKEEDQKNILQVLNESDEKVLNPQIEKEMIDTS